VPKALVPVGNKPLISYPLDALVAAGFHDVIVVRAAFNSRLLPRPHALADQSRLWRFGSMGHQSTPYTVLCFNTSTSSRSLRRYHAQTLTH
jgi:hypothetical protein